MQRVQRLRRHWRLLIVAHGEWLLLIPGAILVLLLVQDYGISWDEHVQSTYGELAWRYFASLGQDQAVNHYLDLRYYGPLWELLGAGIHRIAGGDLFLWRHGLTALAWVGLLVATARYAREVGGPRLALLATLALATTPRVFGHAFINSKDIPFACGFAWAMLAILRVSRRWPAGLPWPTAVAAGFAIGATMAVRIGGLLLVPFLAAGVALHGLLAWRAGSLPGARVAWRRLGLQALAIAAIAWGVAIAAWPWAHSAPLAHPWQALQEISNFSAVYPVRYAGQTIASNDLPRTYLPSYLSITTPLPHLLLACLGLVIVMMQWRRADRRLAHAVTALWLLFPIAYVMAARPNIYDGLRQFLFVLPALAVTAAIGADWVVVRLRGRWRTGAFALLLAALCTPVVSLVRLHPYEMTYFNLLVGGLRGAGARFETDYWTISYREAVEWLNRLPPHPDGSPINVVVAANSNNLLCAAHYAAPHLRLYPLWTGTEPTPPRVDYYLATTRYGLAERGPGLPVVHVVGREGVPFAVIKAIPQPALR